MSFFRMVHKTGFEPVTSAMSTRRFYQLSYSCMDAGAGIAPTLSRLMRPREILTSSSPRKLVRTVGIEPTTFPV